MKASLIALGLTLLCSVLAVDGLDGDVKKAMGMWYIDAMASDCKCMMKHKEKMKMVKVVLNQKEGSNDVTMDTTIPMPGGCKKISMDFEKNEETGEYSHTCEWGKKTIKKIVTNPDGSMTAEGTHEKDGKVCRVWTHLVRNPSGSKEGLDSFVREAEDASFAPEQIMRMPPKVACSESQ